jgi:hypothetical protein
MTKYTEWQYLFPPRPEFAIASAMLRYYEKQGWVAQYKKNGTNTIIGISPKKEFFTMTRHATEHKAWEITPHIKAELTRLFPEKKWFVLCAELMHNKTPSIKDTIYIHDVIVWKSEFLLNSLFMDRQKLLDERLITNVEAHSHYVCDSEGKIWYAKRFEKGFKELFLSIKNPKIDEGLVLKDPNGQLRSCRTASENSGWQVKCRHESKGYSF